MPWLDYSKVPWARPPAGQSANVQAVVENLRENLDSIAAGLSALTNQLINAAPIATGANVVTLTASEFDDLAAKDFSTMLGQNFSVNYGQDLSANLGQNLSVSCGQLLSTSYAVPTAPPWSIWGNGPHAVVVGTPAGEIVVPTFPPRTAWGNGPGVVITTPGGAVFSMVPTAAPSMATKELLANSDTLHELNSQLQVVQEDVNRLETILKNQRPLTEPSPPIGPPAPTAQPYLPPTGR